MEDPAARKVMGRHRRRAVGLTGVAGAFVTLGLGQLASAPDAHADEFDVLIDQVLNSMMSFLELDSVSTVLGSQTDTELVSWLGSLDPVGAASADAQAMSQNLLVNPSFETADPSGSGYSGVTIPGWNETGTPTVIAYGTPMGYPSPVSTPIPAWSNFPQTALPGAGDNFAGGGPVGTSSISQTVDVTGAAGTPYALSADLGGQGWDPSSAGVQVTFYDAHGAVVGTGALAPVSVWDRLGFTGLEDRSVTGTVPEGAVSAQVTTTFTDRDWVLGNYNGAYADNESFTVGDPGLTAAPLAAPTSDVDPLDHVFVIYMENKGAADIVGSPNAPYMNNLINTYGYDDNYYALGHPSDPNYFRILGGSDFGIDYNSALNSIDAPNLMQEMDQAGISWAGYAQSMPTAGDLTASGDYSPDELPFAQFGYVYGNTPDYLQEHLLPLTQLSTDLKDPSTFPGFTWIAANEDNNGEGPVNTLSGVLQFIATQFGDHQYNVSAADQFVQQEVSTIESSKTWTDPNERDAIIIVTDEDNNNLSLGFGNQGNNVPLIVIPSAGAVSAGGMESGHVTTDDYYNEYSVMATIEQALGLAPLTANDTYATPLNAFWNGK